MSVSFVSSSRLSEVRDEQCRPGSGSGLGSGGGCERGAVPTEGCRGAVAASHAAAQRERA
eukprot:scaffold38934_cov55-Phaeocystis_antarctica.AAC.4